MKITAVKAFAHAAPTPDMRGNGRNYSYVKIETDEGLVGWGECTCGTTSVLPMVEELGSMLIGEDPSQIERHWQRLFHCQHNIRGGIVHMAALSGIDIALWDLKGKAMGVPVYELLGGATRDRLWAYGRFDGHTPDKAATHARREVARGFTALKGDPFMSFGPEHTMPALREAAAIVLAVREAVGPDVELLIEAHGRLNLESATRVLDEIASARPYLIEEPLPPEDLRGLALLRGRTRVQIAAGERLLTKWSFAPLLQDRLIDIAQPDPAHAGGITEVRKIAALAETHQIAIQPHNPYGPINTLAAAHLNTALPNFLIMELIMEEGMHEWFSEATGAVFPAVIDGYFPIPPGPGLGFDIDENFIKRYPPVAEIFPSSYLRTARFPSRQGQDWR
jgi:galactonate dehydratase